MQPHTNAANRYAKSTPRARPNLDSPAPTVKAYPHTLLRVLSAEVSQRSQQLTDLGRAERLETANRFDARLRGGATENRVHAVAHLHEMFVFGNRFAPRA